MSFSRHQIQVFSLISVSILAHVTLGGGRVLGSLYMLRHGGSGEPERVGNLRLTRERVGGDQVEDGLLLGRQVGHGRNSREGVSM